MDGSLVSLNGLLAGNQVFDIPVYQRGYAWERKNLEDLREDLYYLDPSKKHYFGTVLLKDSGKTARTSLAALKRFDLIDGQQRLTTVSIYSIIDPGIYRVIDPPWERGELSNIRFWPGGQSPPCRPGASGGATVSLGSWPPR